MQVVILCGGKGTRLREKTETLPKPLVEIGGRPIVWHVIQWYAHFGQREFLLACGYLGDRIADWVAAERHGDLAGLSVECVDTGAETQTGGRVAKLAERLDGRFACTYADGLTDLRLPDLLATHERAGTAATLTAVRPENPFGVLELDDQQRVRRFIEKPPLRDWINGGFFIFERAVLERLDDDAVLEREPLAGLAAEGALAAHRHQGFWACMDTYKDHERLDGLWAAGAAPWRVWPA